MGLFVYISTILYGLFLGKGRIALCLIFFVMWVFYAFNYGNGDYLTYKTFYENRTFDMWGVEVLFGFLAHSFKELQLSYADFQVAVASITLLLLFRFIREVRKPITILLIFFVFFFPLDYVLMRNFLAFTIILQGVLLKLNDGKNSTLGYIFFVLIATLIHQSSILYLIFAFSFSTRRVRLDIFLCAFILFGLAYAVMRGIFIYTGLHALRFEMYSGTVFMFLVNVIIYVSNFILVKFFLAFTFLGGERINKYKSTLFNINLMLFFLLIPSFDIPIIIRVLRHCLFINIVIMLLIVFYQGRGSRGQIAILVAQLFFVFVFFISPVYSDSLGAMLQNNIWFESGL